MTEPLVETQAASDGYPIHVAVWPAAGPLRGRVVVLHGVQSHGGWYHRLGRTLAGAGYEAHFPDRRGSGANHADRGHTPSARRLLVDVAERLQSLRDRERRGPDRAGRDQLGRQARRAHRRATPRPGRRAGPDLPRPAPSRRGLARASGSGSPGPG